MPTKRLGTRLSIPSTHSRTLLGQVQNKEVKIVACNTRGLVVKAVNCTRFESHLSLSLFLPLGDQLTYHLYLPPQSMAGISVDLSPVVLANKERNGASNLNEEEEEEESLPKHNSTSLGRREDSSGELRKQESAPDSEERNTSKWMVWKLYKGRM